MKKINIENELRLIYELIKILQILKFFVIYTNKATVLLNRKPNSNSYVHVLAASLNQGR